ncbi:MAG: OmpA family protein [Flavobacteriales bacterium]|nr:OmpA family protein [Flavobacteriales bacterium]
MRISLLYLFATLFCFSALQSQAQSKREWLYYGDEAYKKGDYASAAKFYLKVLDEGTLDEESTVYPYEVVAYIKPDKEENKPAAATEAPDSTQLDSLMRQQGDTVPPQPDAANPTTGDQPIDAEGGNLVYGKYQYVVHQIADCFRLSYQYKKAEQWYAKAVQNESKRHPFARYNYAMVLMNNEKYPESQAQLEKFIETYDGTDNTIVQLAQKKLFNVAFAESHQKPRPKAEVNLMDTVINGGTSSFGANFYNDEGVIIFASGRKDNVVLDEKNDDPTITSDLYLTDQEGGNWQTPKNMRRPVNTEGNEGAGVISIDRSHFYFTRCDSKGECAIYLSRFLNGKWLLPMKLNENINQQGYSSKYPALSPEEDRLFFASDRPGGYGKMDIWVSPIDEFGNAGEAKNLGSVINTSENEVTPYLHHINNTLYFSSDGHTGLGGLDVFRSYGQDSTWLRPINMGRPFNSGKDDLFFVVDRMEGRTGFMTSDRDSCESCKDNKDLFCYKIYQVQAEPLLITMKGTVFNRNTQEKMPNTLVQITDVKEGIQPIFIITNEEGQYNTTLIEDIQYFSKAQKVKFFADAFSLSTENITKSTEFTHDFYLEPIPPDDIEIPGIEYDYNDTTLRPASKKVLDDLFDFLQLNDDITVEIGSHTDARGSDSYNLKLSQGRANSVVHYLIDKGIPKERLKPHGYGETRLLIQNATTEEEHQKNRRTAFKVTDQQQKVIGETKY